MELKEILSLFSKETARLARTQNYLKLEIARLKEKLAASNKTLSSLFTHFADGLIYINHERKIELCNEPAADLLGMKKESLMGKSYPSLFPDSFFGFSMNEMLSENRGVMRLFHTLPLSPGTAPDPERRSRDIEIMANPIRDAHTADEYGGGVLLLLKDAAVTPHKAAREPHESSFQPLSEIINSLAHEIRNPLTAIDGFATLLAFELKEKSAREKARSILEGTRLIARLLDDALIYCEAPKARFVLTDLKPLVEEVIRHFEVASQERGRVIFETSETSCESFVDAELLKLALFNLLKNGLEASPTNHPLQIALHRETNHFAIAVSDSGNGIEPSAIEKLFTPHFTTKSSGHGLGLAETYKAITVQGGTLSVESTLGKGSTFAIKLPFHCPIKTLPSE